MNGIGAFAPPPPPPPLPPPGTGQQLTCPHSRFAAEPLPLWHRLVWQSAIWTPRTSLPSPIVADDCQTVMLGPLLALAAPCVRKTLEVLVQKLKGSGLVQAST